MGQNIIGNISINKKAIKGSGNVGLWKFASMPTSRPDTHFEDIVIAAGETWMCPTSDMKVDNNVMQTIKQIAAERSVIDMSFEQNFKILSNIKKLPSTFQGEYILLPDKDSDGIIHCQAVRDDNNNDFIGYEFSFQINGLHAYKITQNGLTLFATNSLRATFLLDVYNNTIHSKSFYITNDSSSAITFKDSLWTENDRKKTKLSIELSCEISGLISDNNYNEFVNGGIPISYLQAPLKGQIMYIQDKERNPSDIYGISGVVNGLLIANSSHFYDLEPGAMYLLMTNTHLITGAYRGSQTYLIASHGKRGATTTAQGVGHHVQIGTMGTAGLTLQHATYTASNGSGSTFYGSRIGIGACTTQCCVKYSLFKVMGSDDDFEI